MPEMERRAGPCEVRALPEEGAGGPRFEGYAALFNSWSRDMGGFREQIAPGAFAHAIGADDVRALWNHDPNYVLGRNRAGTLTLTEDERGLRFEVQAPDAQWARDLRESVKRGDVNQCSFGFAVIEDEWRKTDGIDERTLKDVRLMDVSLVTYPAYEATTATARAYAPVPKPAANNIRRRRLDWKERTI